MTTWKGLLGQNHDAESDLTTFPERSDKQRLENSLNQSVNSNPDQATSDIKISQKAGIPTPVVERNREQLHLWDKLKDFDFDDIIEKSPGTAQFLTYPDNAKQAHDDVDNLREIERGFLNNTARRIGERTTELTGQLGAFIDQSAAAIDEIFPTGGFSIGFDDQGFSFKLLDSDEWKQKVSDGENTIANISEQLKQTDFDSRHVHTWEAVKQAFTDENTGALSATGEVLLYATEQGLASIPDMVGVLVSLPAYIASRSSEIGEERAELKGKEQTIRETLEALPFAIGSALLEKFGAGKVFGASKDMTEAVGKEALKEALKEAGKSGVVEGGTEFIQEGVMEYLGARLGTGAELKITEALEQGFAAMVAGGIYGSQMSAATQSANQVYNRQIKSMNDMEKVDQIITGIEKSKLKDRNVDAIRGFLKTLGKRNDADKVYLDPEGVAELFQEQVEPEVTASEVYQRIQKEIEPSIESGSSIELNIEDLADLVSIGLHRDLQPHMVTDIDALTPAQMQNTRVQEEVQALNEMGEQQLSEEAFVYNDVLGQELGRGVDRSRAEAHATMMEAVFRTFSKREGITQSPIELYKRFNPTFKEEIDPLLQQEAKQIETTDILLDRLREGDIPTETDIFGESLLQFIRSKGGIVDEGGELAARDAGEISRPRTGKTLDEISESAMEAGFIQERDSNILLAAIDKEKRGQKVFGLGQENGELQTIQANLLQLDDLLGRAGIDLNAVTNQEVRQFLEGPVTDETLEGVIEPDKLAQTEVTSFDKTPEGKLIGYKVMAVDEDGNLQSGANKNLGEFQAAVGSELSMPGEGVFLSNDPDYATDFYSGLAENEVLVKVEFDRSDVVNGESQLNDQQPEIGVSKVKIVQVEPLDEDSVAADLMPRAPETLEQTKLNDYPTREDEARDEAEETNLQKAKEETTFVLRGIEGTILGNSITAEFKDRSAANLIGQKLTSTEDLATLAQVYRNPSFETLRYYLLKDDEIIFHTGVTSRQPGSSMAFPGPSGEVGSEWLSDMMNDLGANGYFLTHNHPSGNPNPSSEDLNFTTALSSDVAGFKGHVIINHKTYSTISDAGDVTVNDLSEEILQDSKREYSDNAKVSHSSLGMAINKPESMAGLVTNLNNPENIILVGRASQTGKINLIVEVNSDSLVGKDKNTISAVLNRLKRESGSSDVLIASYPSNNTDLNSKMIEAVSDGVLLDAIDDNGASLRMKGVNPSANLETGRKESKGYEVHRTEKPEELLQSEVTEFEQAEKTGFEGDNVVEATEWNSAVEKGLDMSQEARMARAKAMGFDTSKILYHGTAEDFDAFDPDRAIGTQFWSTTDKSAVESGDVGAQGKGVIKALFSNIQNPAGWKEYENLGIDEIIGRGFDGVVLPEEGSETVIVFKPNQYRSIHAAFDPDAADSANLLAQSDKKKTVRGKFNKLTNEITFTKNANLSTFLHENGHFFLEVMRELATESPDIQADLDKLETWWTDNDIEGERNQHEFFANTFEAFLMEGKSPTPELQSLFTRFSKWLSMIYKRIDQIFLTNQLPEAELSDEVREVMNRLFATNQEIDNAQTEMKFGPLPVEQLGLNPDEAIEYQKMVDDAEAAATKTLTAEVMRELQREQQKWWKEGAAKEKEIITQDLNEQRVYQARDLLTGDRVPEGAESVKLDRKYIAAIYGKKPAAKLGRMSSNDGLHPDLVAFQFGYESGDQLIRDLLGSMTKAERKSYIDRFAEDAMKQKHGDLINDGTVDQAADFAVHNEKQADLLFFELRFLNRSSKTKTTPRKYFKAAAENQMRITPVDEIRPDVHRRNEIKARNSALKAAAEGNFKRAGMEQHKALRQFYLFREANIAKEQAEKHRNRLHQMSKTKYSTRKVHPNYIQQLKLLVASYDLRKSPKESNDLLFRVNRFIEAQKETNPDLVAGDVIESIQNWRKMTVDDLGLLRNAAENLLTIGKKNSDEQREQFLEVVDEIVVHTEENSGRVKRLPLQNTVGKGIRSFIRGFTAAHRKFESILRQADAWEDKGPLQKYIMRPLIEAANNAIVMRGKAHDAIAEIFKGNESLFNPIKQRNDTVVVGSLGKMTRGDRIMLALNWGNIGNREALVSMRAYPLTESQVEAAIATLTDSDLDLVEKIWDYLDTFYPELAKTEQESTGIAPAKVESESFTVNGRVMKGGYYPLQGDALVDSTQNMHDIEERAKRLKAGGGAGRASSKHGATIERKGWKGKALNLSIDGLFRHVDGVIHDITHRKAVIQTDRILNNQSVKDAVTDSVGEENYRVLKNKLVEVAAGHVHPSEMTNVAKMLRYTRLGLTYNVMGYSLRTGLVNITGFASAIPTVGKARMAQASMQFLASPIRETKFVLDRSVAMQHRAEVISRDVFEISREIKSPGPLNKIRAYAFVFIAKVDAFVSRITWLAAYDKGMGELETEEDAIFFADRTVARTQGSGLLIDQSSIESQNEWVKAFTPFYSYFNAQLNLLYENVDKSKRGYISKGKLLENLMWIMLVPALLEEAMVGQDKDEDEDDLVNNRWTKAVASYNLGYWIGIRDTSGLVKYGIPSTTPLSSALKLPFDLYTQAAQGDIDKTLLRATTGIISTLLHIPGGVQTTRSLGYLMDLEEQGGSLNLYDFLVTGKLDQDE